MELNELIRKKHEIEKEICEKEFEEKGYKQILETLGIKYYILRRTPLGKNDYHYKKTIGIPKEIFWNVINKDIWVIIGIFNPLKVDEHNFYIFRKEDSHFIDGYTNTTQYVNYILTLKDDEGKETKNSLKLIGEVLDEIK